MLENDEDDQYIARQYLENEFPFLEVTMVTNSEDFITMLQRDIATKAPPPALLLLNYNSTPLNASELLRRIRSDASLRHIPSVVLSGVNNPTIIRDCYASGANSFIIKPATVDAICQTITAFVTYWFRTVQLAE